jgi:DNA polymerase-3 subunit gamma/tau
MKLSFMSSQTYYLKYRPALISELDNKEVAEKLTAYLKTGKVPHAFLLVGHKGTGKTSSARLIAKAINCERNLFSNSEKRKAKSEKSESLTGFEPCNECELCTSITEGNNPDVMEIDAASNTSVEDIRDLRDKVRLSPSMSRNKVYIIDEVHMISKSAFNALLKTLEEPPENTVFILATTELEKVPETIVSRCTLINFKPADAESINRSVSRIIKGEKIKIDTQAVDEIIAHAGGSFRDAAKILEQAVYLAGKKEITKDVVMKITGGQSANEAYELLENIISAAPVDAIKIIENLKEDNVDLRGFVKQVLEVLHEVLLAQVGIASDKKSHNDLSEKIDHAKLKIIIEQFEKAYGEMKFSDIPELPVELAILEIANSNSKFSISVGVDLPVDPHNGQTGRSVPTKMNDNNSDFWKNLINKVNTESKQLAGVLRSCKLIKQDKKEIEIEAASQFHYDRLHDTKAINLIERCALELLKHDVTIVSVLKN